MEDLSEEPTDTMSMKDVWQMLREERKRSIRLQKDIDERDEKLKRDPRTTSSINQGHSQAPTLAETKHVFRALQTDWENPYFPDSFSVLRGLVQKYHLFNMNDYYAKTLVFVQSSGTGKSRLADVFGQKCPMINFVLREKGTNGFPPPDLEILSFLREEPPRVVTVQIALKTQESQESVKRRVTVAWNHALATALLQASFEEFNTWVRTQPWTTMTLEALASNRHDDMAPSQADFMDAMNSRAIARTKFCESVAQKARSITKKLYFTTAWHKNFENENFSAVHHNLEKGSALSSLRNAAENLKATLQQCQNAGTDHPLLVIVFDEASSLIEAESSPVLETGLYVALNRIISCLKQFPVWSFFLSTESLIRQLVPPSNDGLTSDYVKSQSARIPPKGDTILQHFPPFVSLQLDVEDRRRMMDPGLRDKELLKPLTTFAELKHMALFGRPLWHAYAETEMEMLQLAKLKLIGGDERDEYRPWNTDHVFAALSFRLSLDVCLQNPSSMSLNRTAVNYYMRIVISMDQETGVMDTMTPSEPILAWAAMQCLCRNNTFWSLSISTLSGELLEKGLVDKGHKGELYARLVLILAHDWIRSLVPNTSPGPKPTFAVSDLLFALYAKDHHKHIREIPERILEARMNFTHFVPTHAPLTTGVISSLCRDLFRRSAAMQLCESQETYDLLLPVYYGPEDEKFNPSDGGLILVQVKNRVGATTVKEIFGEDFINISPKKPGPAKSKAKEPGPAKSKAKKPSPAQSKAKKPSPAQSKAKKSDGEPGCEPEHQPACKPEKLDLNKMKYPILFLLFDLGVERSPNAYSPLVQVMRREIGEKPELWAIHSRGHDEKTFGCLKHTETAKSCERFFAAVNVDDTPANKLSLRNRTFYELEEGFRYPGYGQHGDTIGGESEAGMQEGETSEGRSVLEVQDEEASDGGSDAAGPSNGALKRRTESTEGETSEGRSVLEVQDGEASDGGSDAAGPGNGALKRRTESTEERRSKRQRVDQLPAREH